MADLPPPPSALSPGSSTSGEEGDEEEDEFISRLRSSSSTSPRRARRVHTSSRWGGIKLGDSEATAGIHLANSTKVKGKGAMGMNARERALWRWINVEDLDGFLQECYLYYVGRGIWAIGLSRLLNLL